MLVTLAACGAAQQQPSANGAAHAAAQPALTSPADALAARARQYFSALPQPPATNATWVALGRRLFFDTRVSADGQVGCVTCHLPDKWATDGLPQSKGTSGRLNPRNAPTVFNAFLQSSAHWRGDRESVEDQAKRALLGPPSFGLASEADASAKLDTLGYAAVFQAAFPSDPQPVSPQNWATAIGAYERTLLTPAPFDAFLAGDTAALNDAARTGLAAFIDTGCADCHAGVVLGGQSFKKFGRTIDYVTLTHSDHTDSGRFDVTHDEADRNVFKVPPLRNVAHTAPYFHDGSVTALPEAVRIMAKAQLDVDLPNETVAAIAAFLEALTGPVPTTFSAPPP